MWTLAFGHHEDRTATHGYAAAGTSIRRFRYRHYHLGVGASHVICRVLLSIGATSLHWNDDDFDVLADAVTGTIPNTEVSLGYSRGGNIFPDLRSSARLANSSYSSATVSMARLVAESVTLSAIARVCRARSRQCSGSFRYDKTSPTVRSDR
jgi:hypothetical protein